MTLIKKQMNNKRIHNTLILTGLFSVVLFLAGQTLFAQIKDPEADKILKEFKDKTQSYPAIKADFKITIIDLKEDTETSYTGEFTLKGAMYVMKMNNMEIFYDGTTLWNYLADEEEVNINTPDPAEEGQDFFENPSLFFTDYRKDFSYKLIQEEEHKGRTYEIIDLYPNDLNKPYSRIRIYLDKDKLELFSARYFGKNGVHYQLKIMDYNYHPVDDSLFKFDVSKHPGVEIIDLR